MQLASNDMKQQNSLGVLNDYTGYLNSQIQQLGYASQYMSQNLNQRTAQNMGSGV